MATGQFSKIVTSAPRTHTTRRFSILWKAAIGERQPNTGNLTLDRIMSIFTADIRHRRVDFQIADPAWILLLQRIYADSAVSPV
jgi:hypothetical protein